MEALDILILQLYSLSIFATLVKPKIKTNVYRTLKLFVVLLYISVLFMVSSSPFEGAVWILIIKLISVTGVLIVMIQTEVRLLLRFFGVKTGLLLSNVIEEDVKVEVLRTVDYLAARKIGALITFERNVALDDYIKQAFQIDAPLNGELLSSIFIPQTPLHDGAVIIKNNKIMAAGTYFPPSENPDIPKHLGSRHRAGIGISEVTDALTIIVSEQSGFISVALNGYLDQDISKDSLLLYLEKYLQN
ncbi:MAG: diadenylate cyclase [Bacillota bacterium]